MSKDKDPISPRTVFIIVTTVVLVLAGVAIGLTWRYIIMIDRSGEVGNDPDPYSNRWSDTKDERLTDSDILFEDRDPKFKTFVVERTISIVELVATLRWRDEPSDVGYVNEPDHFRLSLKTDKKEQIMVAENHYDGEGVASITIINGNLSMEKIERMEVRVELVYAGDQVPQGGPRWLERADGSNEYDLNVEYSYRELL